MHLYLPIGNLVTDLIQVYIINELIQPRVYTEKRSKSYILSYFEKLLNLLWSVNILWVFIYLTTKFVEVFYSLSLHMNMQVLPG